ncbi:4'-phosphopantetheinyl transferase [Paenibacillus sp. JCM 10914]|nr:4'-phosphopantetheinyl transferase [Paenibacillus sp. JCM 10914]
MTTSKIHSAPIEVYAIQNSDRISEQTYASLFQRLSPERAQYVMRFKQANDYQRSLLGDAMLHRIIQERLGIERRYLEYARNQYGKPYLKEYPDIHFNISHSGHWIVCAVSDDWIGIDVEQVNVVDLAIADRFFHPAEREQLLHLHKNKRQSLFFDFWTLKESYIKAVGKGLHLPLDSFALEMRDEGWAPIMGEEGRTFFFRQYEIEEGYKMSVCSPCSAFPDRIQYISAEYLTIEDHQPI